MQQCNKTLKFSQIFNLNFGSLGIQFAWALSIANMTGIYSFFGVKASDMGFLWIAFPVTGIVIQFLIGYLSDRTQSSFGKRLPYIFWGAVITAISLVLLPNAHCVTIAIIYLWLFTAAINAALLPFRPLVADITPPSQHTKVYAIQAALIGIGATLASMMPWILLHIVGKHTNTHSSIPFEIRFSFYIGAIVLIFTNSWTVLTTKKYIANPHNQKIQRNITIKTSCFEKINKAFSHCLTVPKIIWQVSLVQFFTWVGVFCFIVYLTPTLEHTIFQMPIGTDIKTHKDVLENSIILTGEACAVYTFFSILFAYCIPYLSSLFSRKKVHVFALFIGGISLIAINFAHGTLSLFTAMVGIGFSWASFNSIPFAMIAHIIPREKLGAYMGIFNISICLPQIIVGLTAGFLLKSFFHQNPALLMITAGVFFLLASSIMMLVNEKNA